MGLKQNKEQNQGLPTILKKTTTTTTVENQQAAVPLPTPPTKEIILRYHIQKAWVKVSKMCKKHGIQVYFTEVNHQRPPGCTQRQRSYNQKGDIIYRFKCDRVECNEEYIGESSRTFGERFKEHHKSPFPKYDHFNTTGHTTRLENFRIVGREDQNLWKLIKEAIYIKVNNPSLNRNTGKYHLPHIWDEALLTSQNSK